MENMHMQVREHTLTITVDLNKNLGLSKSGKSNIVATSQGNVKVPGTDVIIGLNVYRKAT